MRILTPLQLLESCLLVWLFVFAARPVQADLPGPDDWIRVDAGLPGFAHVSGLALDPNQPGTLYAATYTHQGLYRSSDQGQTWQRGTSGEADPALPYPANAIVYLPRQERWWAATTAGLFSRPIHSDVWFAEPELAGPITGLVRDRVGRLYALQSGTGLFRRETDGSWGCIREETSGLSLDVSAGGELILLGTAGHGLWISRDAGRQWQPVPGLEGTYVTAVLAGDPGAGQPFLAVAGDRVLRSEDGGRSWTAISQLEGAAYTLTRTADGQLYAGLAGGVARSTDAGQSWTVTRDGLSPQPVLDILADPASELIYAATRDGVYISHDKGSSWQRTSRGLGQYEIQSLVRDGRGGMLAATPLGLYHLASGSDQWQAAAAGFETERFYTLSADAGSESIYAGTGRGLLRSQDNGHQWQPVESHLAPHGMPGLLIDPGDDDHLYARLAYERVYESRDGGQNWIERWAGMASEDEVLTIARDPNGGLWAGTQRGLFNWDPVGQRWKYVDLPGAGQSLFAVAFGPQGQTVYAGTSDGVLCRDQAGRWRNCSRPDMGTVTSLLPLGEKRIYAGTAQNGLFLSCDGGANWQAVPGLDRSERVDVLYTPDAGRTVYVATDRGLFQGSESFCPTSTARPLPASTGRCRLLPSLPIPPSTYPFPAVHTLHPDDTMLRLSAEAGFQGIVQVLSWEEIEPTPGQFHWEYPDALLQAAEYYGLQVLVRLDHPPDWAMASNQALIQPWNLPPAQRSGRSPDQAHPPPFDVDAYAHFVEAVAYRYQGRLRGYVIWNEPNLASEWGAAPDPEAYARLLKRAYRAVKIQDPLAPVVSAGLSPTYGDGDTAMDDRVFLEGMYAAGSAAFFDVLGAHPYGFSFAPDDPHTAHAGLNLNRILDLRAVMEGHADGDKPVWITELGWTTASPPDRAWLAVSRGQQSGYLSRSWWKTRRDYPWAGQFTVWQISQGVPDGDEMAGYNLLDPDGSPKPAYYALQRALALEKTVPSWDWLGTLAGPCDTTILASDVVIHLGDSQCPACPPLYAAQNPSLVWQGGFYLSDPGQGHWRLHLQIQSHEPTNALFLNGGFLSYLPVKDWSAGWQSFSVDVPAHRLQVGRNQLEIMAGPVAPPLQAPGFAWDELLFRDLTLESLPEANDF